MDKTQKMNMLIELSKNPILTNRQMAVMLGIKSATVSLWKRQLRDKGIQIKGKSGRPLKTDPALNLGIAPTETLQ